MPKRHSKIDQAIADLEGEIRVLEHALRVLIAKRDATAPTPKPAAAKLTEAVRA